MPTPKAERKSIPKSPAFEARRKKAIRAEGEADNAIRRHLARAMTSATESARYEAEGNSDATAEAIAEMEAHLAAAVDDGMSPKAFTRGGNMQAKIAKALDMPEPQARALGYLLNAEALMTQVSPASANALRAAIATLEGADAATVERWREVSVPVSVLRVQP